MNLSTDPLLHLIVGYSGSGKTYLTKWLLYKLNEMKRFDIIFIVCPSDFTNSYSYIPAQFRRESYSDEWLLELMEVQKKQAKRPRIAVVFDDCAGHIKNSKEWTTFISTYRHYNITPFIITQRLTSVPPITRTQARFVYLFRNSNTSDIKTLHNEFCSEGFANHYVLKKTLEGLEKYKFLRVDTTLSQADGRYKISKANDEAKTFRFRPAL